MWNEKIKDWDDGFKGFSRDYERSDKKWRLIKMALTRIPGWLAPFNYHKAIAKYGAQTWWNPANLWRQPFHLLLGFGLGVIIFIPQWK